MSPDRRYGQGDRRRLSQAGRSSIIPTRTRGTRGRQAIQGGGRGLRGAQRRRQALAATTASAMPASTARRRRPHFTDVNDIFEAFGDIFGDGVFGDMFGGGARRPRAARGRRPLRRARSTWSKPPAASPRPSSSNGTKAVPNARAAARGRAQAGDLPLLRRARAGRAERGHFPRADDLSLCHGRFRRSEDPCPACRGRGLSCRAASNARSPFRPASTTTCDCGSPARATPAPTVGRAAIATASSTSRAPALSRARGGT